jgi:hypothetical protein
MVTERSLRQAGRPWGDPGCTGGSSTRRHNSVKNKAGDVCPGLFVAIKLVANSEEQELVETQPSLFQANVSLLADDDKTPVLRLPT